MTIFLHEQGGFHFHFSESNVQCVVGVAGCRPAASSACLAWQARMNLLQEMRGKRRCLPPALRSSQPDLVHRVLTVAGLLQSLIRCILAESCG